MARKRNRKNISILENLGKPSEEGYVFSKEGIPREQITAQIYLNALETDIRARLGFYHPEDIAFIEQNYPDLPKEILLKPAVVSSNLSEKEQRGLFIDLRDSFREGEELELSGSFVRLFLKFFTVEENRIWLYEKYIVDNPSIFATTVPTAAEQINEILTKLIEKYEDDIFQLVAFDKYKFEEFDKKIVEVLNENFAKESQKISFPQYAIKTGDGIRGRFYWNNENNEANLIEQKYEPFIPEVFLTDQGSTLWTPLGPGNPEGLSRDLIFKAPSLQGKIVLENKFSSLNLADLSVDKGTWTGLITTDNFWDEQSLNFRLKVSYNTFLVDFLTTLEEVREDRIVYNDRETQKKFNKQILNFLYEETVTFFTSGNTQVSVPIYEYTAKLVADAYRYQGWKNLKKYFEETAVDDIDLENRDEAIFNGVEEAAINADTIQRDPNAPEDDGLTEDDIKERQKFLKQCALMTRLDEMAEEHVRVVVKRAEDIGGNGNLVFNGDRFYMVKDGNHDQHGIVSKLLLPKASSISEFLDIEPSTHAYLVPKLRFFKVFQEGSLSKQEEFKFRNFTLPDRVNNLRSTDYDKGGDYGIKEFSFSFEGTTPATAKNDIKANLSLYFQSFDDFINKQPENNSPFVDMLLLPGGSKKKGSGQESPFQFQPDYYRLRVDVGWIIPDNKLANVIGPSRYNSLLDALTKTNKSFYLNMVDHTIDFRDDGSVQIDVEYRAYIESALKGTILDALSSRETRAAANKTRQDYLTILNSKKCNAKELGQIKRQLLQIEDLLKKQTYQSIMKRLLEYDMLYYKKLRTTSANSFVKNGFFTSKVSFETDTAVPSTGINLQESTDKTLNYGDNFYNEDIGSDKDHLLVNYFYLGDLLYVILDSLYDENENYYEGYENFKFVLGSLQYEDIFDSTFKNINIASIPVSAELFFEWYTENIIKPERNSYPIMFFIRDLLKFLIGEILSETCFKRSLDKKLQFHTTNFIGINDPLSLLFSEGDPIIDANVQYNNGKLPLVQDDGKPHTISDFTNYIMIYVDTPKLSINGKNGNKQEDGDIGIYHYQIGRPKGLLKKLNFSKTDMQYIREARFFRNGFDGLMQLANVYNVNLDMIGNTLYYPGMEIYVNPLGFMGAANNNYDPTEPNSIANKLGFGGYHLVTSVKSTIAPGKFTTQVTAMFNYSGDGDPAKVVVGTSEEIKPVVEKPKVDDRPQTSKDYCSAAYNQVIDTALNIVNNKTQSYPGIDFNTINQTIAQSNAAKWEQAEKSIEEINDVSFEELRVREQLRKNQEGGN